MNILKLKQMLQQFLMEDIGECDVTSDTIFDKGEQGTLTFIAKEGGVFSGGTSSRRDLHCWMSK
ncbi:hypothetical protein KEH51_22430 [[Brevibacterium] frigoritolerans]|uniref:Uncharacterized protein n=1 Tax=Peribacillus frigoritolerans TaxID=450367 RepID=A0A941FJ99_9BACI|nr:hypothetical protein [Peribacillus frigoritolerans]